MNKILETENERVRNIWFYSKVTYLQIRIEKLIKFSLGIITF